MFVELWEEMGLFAMVAGTPELLPLVCVTY